MLDETLNKIKKMDLRINPAMLDKDARIQIQNDELKAVSELTYEEISIRSQSLSMEIEIRNERRQALRTKMSELYQEADEDRREELRKYSIVPQTFREEEKPKKISKTFTPEEKREKKINATMMQFNLSREKAIKYLHTLEED